MSESRTGSSGDSAKTHARTKKRLERNLEWINKVEPAKLSPIYIRSIISDLHDRQVELEMRNEELLHAQMELQRMNERYSSFYERAPVGCITLGESGRIVEINRSASDMLRIPKDRLDSLVLVDFIVPEDVSRLKDCIAALDSAGDPCPCELRMLSAGGPSFPAHLDAFKACDGTFIIIIRKLQEQVHTEEKRLKILKVEELLIKEMRHRIKNQLNCIISLLDMRLMEQKTPSAVSALQEAKRSLFAMESLYDALCRTDNQSEVPLKDYFLELVDNLFVMYPDKKIKVETEFDDFSLKASVLFPLGIILNEIVTNSMKYAFDGKASGVIRLASSKENNRVTIHIGDDGNGGGEFSAMLGKPEAADSGMSSTGLGLQLISALVEQIGGTLKVGQGSGTVYTLEFSV